MLLFRKILKIIQAIIHPLIVRLPAKIDEHLIFIEGPWGMFEDNSAALLDALIAYGVNDRFRIVFWVDDIRKYRDIKHQNVVFLDKRGVCAYVRLIRAARKCRYYFFSNVTSPAGLPRKNQVHFYLSHGIPLKCYSGFKHHEITDTRFLSLSDFASTFWQYANHLPNERFVPLGFPRNDLLLQTSDALVELGIPRAEYRRVIVWMPTFRRRKRERLLKGAEPLNNDIPLFDTREKLAQLDVYCRERGILLLLKLHAVQEIAGLLLPENATNIRVLTTEDHLLPKRVRNYQLLAEADALITDYSSVAFDYLLTNRPIGYVIDDIDTFRQQIGFGTDNPLAAMPGAKINSIEDFFAFLNDCADGHDPFSAERMIFTERIHTHMDADSGKRLLEFFKLI